MRVFLKSPVRENCTPGSVRGQLGNWLSYRDDNLRGQGLLTEEEFQHQKAQVLAKL